jgi:serine/threonine protein kinase
MHTYLSTTHVAAGTASYMSPECFAGGHVGEKADVYSLGCMLWECVTGERPWKGYNVVQVAYQVTHGPL